MAEATSESPPCLPPRRRRGFGGVSVVRPRYAAGGGERAGRSRNSMHALLKFLSTWGVVEAAVAITSILGGKRIAIGGSSRGRWCGPHNASGQGCRCSTDRGHQHSRL